MTEPPATQIGLIGLAVMGQNLALNLARNGFAVAVYNRTQSRVQSFVHDRVGEDARVFGATSLQDLVASVQRPRKIILMVRAGAPVDELIDKLTPLLEPDDILVDGGNSHPRDTERRCSALAEHDIAFVGMGVSGGEEGALHGPSLMPGGVRWAYDELEPFLTKIAAQVDDGPCVAYLGPGSAGHFVKMVHNGIEYGDMQLIAESYDLMRTGLAMKPEGIAGVFSRWNTGPLESYLTEITADIFTKTDPDSGSAMVDVIVDRAGQKGTGRWASELALELGVPVPTIHAAVDARILSSRREQRLHAAEVLSGPTADMVTDRRMVEDIHDALYASKICSYAQGMDLLRTQSLEAEWQLDLAEIARIWKGGCIIRAKLLDRIQQAFGKQPGLDNLLLDSELGGWVVEHQTNWRQVFALAAEQGIPALAMGASLSYFDSYRRAWLPQNLTQAQRDYFGAHTFERLDRPAGQVFHADWDAL